jgi:hypothetical protein
MHNELKREWRFERLVRKIIKSFHFDNPLTNLSATVSEWSSLTLLIQELMGGAVRRNCFTRCELDLLLDLQVARLRKSARADALRRYLRAVQQSLLNGTAEPPRFSVFLEDRVPRKAAAGGGSQ